MKASVSDIPAISVVHLVWLPLGIDMFKRFLVSYKVCPAGYEHTLILLFNGVLHKQETLIYEQYATNQGIRFISYYIETGQDIDAYFWIASRLSDEYLLFFNSYSEILEADWLKKYLQAMHTPDNAGIIGATGSYTSPYNKILKEHTWKWEASQSFSYNYRKYKLLLKTVFLYNFYFHKFPNPHIRSNAFLIKRDIFVGLKKPLLKKKMDAYMFECGRNSMTNQLQKLRLKAFVMDKYGNLYDQKNWAESHTFWIFDQENLLVSDNQTGIYKDGSILYRKHLSFLAWGTT